MAEEDEPFGGGGGNPPINNGGNLEEIVGSRRGSSIALLQPIVQRPQVGAVHRRVRHGSGSSTGSMSGKRKKLTNGIKHKMPQKQMARAALACSLLLLAAVCAAHLLLDLAINFGNGGTIQMMPKPAERIDRSQIETRKALQSRHWPPLSAKIVQRMVHFRLEGLVEDLTNLPSGQQQKQGWPSAPVVNVNMLLTEQRRRTAVQRQRSPTPFPTGPGAATGNVGIGTTRPAPRQPNSASNSENWPPQPPIEASTSTQVLLNDGDEPTLMDFDAIDAYWRWDIEQEKGPAAIVAQQQHHYGQGFSPMDMPQMQQQQQWTRGSAWTEPAEFLYERDIQLLTEKSQFPELALPSADSANANGFEYAVVEEVVPMPMAQEEDYLLADISHSKWEVPHLLLAPSQEQWPTSSHSSMDNRESAECQDFVAFDGSKIVPYQSANNEDGSIGTDFLLNIPLATPPPSSESIVDFFAAKKEDENDVEPSTSSSCAQLVPFIPSPGPSGPILFDDVSLASAALAQNGEDDEEEQENGTGRDFAESVAQPNSIQSTAEEAEEEDSDMLLSALFPQLFPSNQPGSSALLQRSPSLNSLNSLLSNVNNNVNSSNVEVILRELATAELLLNASNMAAAISPVQQQQMSPLNIQMPLQQQQLQFGFPLTPITGQIPLQNGSPLGPSPLSPNLDQFNQTLTNQQLMNLPSSSLASPLFGANANDHDFYCRLPQQMNNFGGLLAMGPAAAGELAVSARCSSTTFSGFGSSGADTWLEPSPFQCQSPKEDEQDSLQQSGTRYENKLVPRLVVVEEKKNRKSHGIAGEEHGKGKQLMKATKSKRGRRSKDESLVNQHGLPFSAERLAGMAYRQYAALMQDSRLTAEQKAMIKKIRRRGRNKLAARKCRERRMGYGKGGNEEEEGEEDEEYLDEEEFGEQQQNWTEQQKEEEEEKQFRQELLDPALISLHPSTSSSSTFQPAPQQFPQQMRTGHHQQQQKQLGHGRGGGGSGRTIRVRV